MYKGEPKFIICLHQVYNFPVILLVPPLDHLSIAMASLTHDFNFHVLSDCVRQVYLLNNIGELLHLPWNFPVWKPKTPAEAGGFKLSSPSDFSKCEHHYLARIWITNNNALKRLRVFTTCAASVCATWSEFVNDIAQSAGCG